MTDAAVHHDADRFRELQVADTALLSSGGLLRQPLPIDLGAILSIALMFGHTFHLPKEAECVEAGVISTLMGGFRTRDLARPGERNVSTEEMGAQIAEFARLV